LIIRGRIKRTEGTEEEDQVVTGPNGRLTFTRDQGDVNKESQNEQDQFS